MFDFLNEKFSDAFKTIAGKSKITESNIEETLAAVKNALLLADVNFKVVKDFIAKVKEKSLGEKVIRGVNPGEQFVKIVHDELVQIMGTQNTELPLEEKKPLVVLVVGLNGQGKTTFSAKLALYLKERKNKKVWLIPADTYRPAAKEQLKVLAASAQVYCYDSDLSQTPAKVARAGIDKALEENIEVIIVDTAGRLHVDQELMQELKDVKATVAQYQSKIVLESLLVADAMTGQEAVNVAKSFHDDIGLTGAVLTKMDSDAKGGAALSIRTMTGIPLRFISTGEKLKDLELFHPDRMAKRILDMGDVVSLVEKAQTEINEDEATSMMKNLEKGKFTIDDFLKQMEMMSRLGSMGSILKMLPGMGGMLRQVGDLSPAENEIKRIKVMIQSMTKSERTDYKIINESRIGRIARGSGTKLEQVKDFLQKFKQMEKMMGQMMGMMKGGMAGLAGMGGLPGMPGGGGKERKKKDPASRGKGPWGNRYF
ncbi:MAG: signal recognition particle protein [Bdellovibrionales bacterium GWA2_49_15]|nr:MAG: signal recognition particle protein [Bdellovibrionales bacterium GWA2_49_15]HAZ12646.1 signal recognition particle protein [Bdellovibrionales bacterium]